MNPRIVWRAWSVAISLALAGTATAAAPWEMLNFKHIEADPNKAYELTDKNGPWVIMVATFAGDMPVDKPRKLTLDAQFPKETRSTVSDAEQDAHDLVLDLRKNFKLNAYFYAKTYDFTKAEAGLGFDKFGDPKRMRNQDQKNVKEYAVLVGDFPRLDDSDAQAVLKRIKQAQPESLKRSKSLAFSDYRRQVLEHVKQEKGPLARAFVTPNPLIPSEYFAPKGPDKFILDLNRGAENSLLDCPGKYSVLIATFKGNSLINQQQIKEVQANRRDLASQLEVAADRAHRMTVELRKRGYEAYEYHDRESSIVTYGNFDSIGAARSDGSIEPLPQIQRAIDFFGAHYHDVPEPGTTATGMLPTRIFEKGPNSDLVFDVKPTPMLVPKRSIAAEYAHRGN